MVSMNSYTQVHNQEQNVKVLKVKPLMKGYAWCLLWSRLEEGLASMKLGVSSRSMALEPMRHDA
jgi:hypothetical protein